MHVISRSALLPYSAADMFALVNDIGSYPEFLPGCLSATVHEIKAHEITATLELGKAGLKKRFTTRNELTPPTSMRMHLVEGPFRHFDAEWTFQALADDACKVSLEMDFVFSSGLIDAALGSLFKLTAQEMVSAIGKRAEQLYGKR